MKLQLIMLGNVLHMSNTTNITVTLFLKFNVDELVSFY